MVTILLTLALAHVLIRKAQQVEAEGKARASERVPELSVDVLLCPLQVRIAVLLAACCDRRLALLPACGNAGDISLRVGACLLVMPSWLPVYPHTAGGGLAGQAQPQEPPQAPLLPAQQRRLHTALGLAQVRHWEPLACPCVLCAAPYPCSGTAAQPESWAHCSITPAAPTPTFPVTFSFSMSRALCATNAA